MTVTLDDTRLMAIADAIREKTGTTELYKPSEMANAIKEIQTGGGSGNIDALIDRSVTEISSNVAIIGENAFTKCVSLISANLPLATKVSHNAFSNCDNLESVNIPLVENVGQNAFSNCKKLTSVNLPCATFINSNAFYKCETLVTADLGSTTYISGYTFGYCHSLKAVIMRSTKKNNLVATSAFNNCYRILGTVNATYNPDGLQDGYFYVPKSIIDSYKGSSDWGTWATQFRALEDYTVDGTITGMLDESKI